MEKKQSRRGFLKRCAKAGGACCALLALNRHLPAQENPDEKKNPIDLKKLAYCGMPCEQACDLFKMTLDNDVNAKKAYHEKWEWKKKFGIDFDPDKVFCYGCKPGDKPLKVGMDQCEVRKHAMANGFDSCIQCSNLTACDKELWKNWPQLHEYSKKLQERYLTQPGAALL